METKRGKEARRELENSAVDFRALSVNVECHYNHVTCPAGVDRKSRLYVINKGGTYLYKCHHCGGSGAFRDKESWSPITATRLDAMTGPFDVHMGTDPLSDTALLWLLNYEIDPEEFPKTFTCDPYSLQIAVYNGDVLKGFQRRYFEGPAKYKTRVQPDTYCHYLIGKEHPDVLFVVEDLLSSYKIWSLGYSVMALLGTSLKGPWPAELFSPKSVVVWLDNDTAGHVGALKFVKEMSILFPNNLYTMFERQPKEVPYTELTTMCGAFV